MPTVVCPSCGGDDVDLVERLDDGRRRVVCLDCQHEWVRGDAVRVYKSVNTVADLRRHFPGPGDVPEDARQRGMALKRRFLAEHPLHDPSVGPFWAYYQQVFSRDGLMDAPPQAFKDFANSGVGAHPGNMSVFNIAWNEMGPQEGARRVRDAIDYLLYAEDGSYLEDRLTYLIQGGREVGMVGFRESLLTKVLCIVEPQRFVPIVNYTGKSGKKEVAERLFQLHLPAPERVSWTIGRRIIWSNDLLAELAGDGFLDMQHAAHYLWWAKDQVVDSAGNGKATGPQGAR
jgi:hypothetical protein